MLGIILALVVFTVGLYYYLTWNYDYWESRGVKGPKPSIIFGTVKDVMCGKICLGDYIYNLYKEWPNEPFLGIYLFQKPYLLIHDLDIIKNVLIKDFEKFAERGTEMHEKFEPLDAHLVSLERRRWRPLRRQFSPVFSAGKLKEMFCMLVECAEHLDKCLTEKIGHSKKSEIMECREFAAKFTTDVIGVCFFGLEANAMSSENSVFREMGKSIFDVSFKFFVKNRIKVYVPSVYSFIGRYFAPKELTNFLINIMSNTADYRKKNNILKADFIDTVMKLRNNPNLVSEIASELDDNLLAAQIYVFFAAGFETSSATISNALYELALYPEIQEKLRNEIYDEIKKTGGCINYHGVQNMKYLNLVLLETLRIHPPIPYLERRATADYTFNIPLKKRVLKINKGQVIWISNYGVQMDSRYFPNPEIFDPERFSSDAVKSRNPMTHLPFGNGPRQCIGKRFAEMLSKVGLFKILQNYRVDCCEKTQIPYVSEPRSMFNAPKDGIHLRITKLPKRMPQL